MDTLHRSLLSRLCIGAAIAAMLGGCGVSQATKDSVSRADTKLQQAQQTLGNSEAGAIELQRAKTHLEQAQAAVKGGDDKPAQQLAQQTELDVDLAIAKAQNGTARKAVAELQASIEQLRQEAQLPTATTR